MAKYAMGLLAALIGVSLLAGQWMAPSLAASADGIWKDIAEGSIDTIGERQIIPQVYRTVALEQSVLAGVLAKTPLEGAITAQTSPVVLSLPTPDGRFARFSVVEAPVMAPELAAKFPEIKTYLGQGVDDRAATVRFDVTPAGFHAMILAPQGRIFIDPYRKGDTTHYISYNAADFLPSDAQLAERLKESDIARVATPPRPAGTSAPDAMAPVVLRTYRLALAADGEYTAFHGGTVSGAMAAIVTSVNRVVGVYEQEVAVRMVLVANNNLIVYTNAATDPYTNNDGFTMLDENQANIDSVIGNANYDIGHVFSTGGGGVAALGVPCSTGEKAQGVTGRGQPVGDPFDIDYVAHEMGHQFGGNHTFNGTTGSCGGGNREGPAAYEPGSGSTIMAYAGICGAEDLQPNSDPYFHYKSIQEIKDYIQSAQGNSCAVSTTTSNNPPTADAGAAFVIPRGTPFTLTGSGSDADSDAITYNWEEYDLGSAAPPNTDNGNRPIFRSFNASTSPARTFPKLSDILNNTSTIGESLPSTSRTMTFRLTVRDNKAGGGGVATDTTTVQVVQASGPFAVTAPNTAVSWAGGSNQTVTWNVANTTAAPVSCANVNILLSTDGGQTFPTSLVAGTANDGSQSISVPNTPSTTARVKVICAGNIFFDISNANFTITAGSGATDTPVVPTVTNTPSPTLTPTVTATPTGPTATPQPSEPSAYFPALVK